MAKDLEIFARREGSNLAEAHWLARLAEIYPGDPGVLAPLLLNLVTLMPGEGLFIRPGTIHSYLEGSGVEVMSSSDNVVRAGLTSKHVDENELLDLAVKNPLEPRIISPEQEAPGILHYSLSNEEVDEFAVRVLSLRDAGNEITRSPEHAAKILLCVEGAARVSTSRDASANSMVDLQPGEAAWVPASVAKHTVSLARGRQTATLYEITSG